MRNIYKHICIGLVFFFSFFLAQSVLGAPTSNIFRTILPEANNTYDIGSAALRWANIYANNVDTTTLTIGGATTFTQGSVIFVGAAGALAQDNSNFFWSDTDNRLGIGTSSPSFPLHIKSGSNTLAAVGLTAGNLNMISFNGTVSTAGLGIWSEWISGGSGTLVFNGTNDNDGHIDIRFSGVQGTRFMNPNNILLAGLTTNGTGVLQFPAATTSAGGIGWGGSEFFLFRDATRSLTVQGAASTDMKFRIANSDSTGIIEVFVSGANGTFRTNGSLTLQSNGTTTALTIDTSQNVGIGTTSPNVRLGQHLDVATSANYGGMSLSTWTTTAAEAPILDLKKSASATIGTQALVASGNLLGSLNFRGSDGSAFQDAASIQVYVDGTPGANDMPGRISFWTTPDGSTTQLERMRIANNGNILVGGLTTNGTGLLQFPSATTTAGGITFGTDVSLHRLGAGDVVFSHVGGINPVLRWNEGSSTKGSIQTSSGVMYISSTTAASLILRTNDTTALTLDSSQNATFAGTITGTTIFAGAGNSIVFTSRAKFDSPADGIITLRNQDATDWGRLQFGGTSSSFPAIKRNSAALNFRLADDSADAAITAAGATFSDTISGTTSSMSTAYLTGSTGYIRWNSRTILRSPADGNVTLLNSAESSFGLLQFGGTSSSFPALARNLTGIQPRLADDSGAARWLGGQGADVASASTITLGSGNSFELTGTTAVNLITNTGWTEGSIITLIANESVTINHATATSGAAVTILLAGAANFAMTANDTLTLIYSSTTAGGVAWREISRTAI